MGAFNNPVLSGLFRGIQLASMIQNTRNRQQNAQSLEAARDEAARRNFALEQRQAELDAERAQEKARDFRLKAREAGAVRLDPSQTEQFRRGEDFSVELAPGIATTASAAAIEGPGGGLFAFPGPVEQGAIDVEERLDALRKELELRDEYRAAPLPARVTDDEGNVHFLHPRTGKEISTVRGVGKKTRDAETPAQRREATRFRQQQEERETEERIEATASVLLDDVGGDPEEALKLLEERAKAKLGEPSEASKFLRRHRIPLQKLLKEARTEGTRSRPNAGDRALSEILGVGTEELDVMRAVSRDMPLKLARAVEAVRNQPPPGEPGILARFGVTDAPRAMTIEEALAAEGVSDEDLAVLRAAGIDVGQLGKTSKASRRSIAGSGSQRGDLADPLGIR